MSIAKQEFTNAGRSMLGRAQNGETLTISKIVVGSGVAGQASDLWPLTALITKEMDVQINTKEDNGAGQLLVEGVFRSDAAPHAFDLHEVGVMAHIGAEADRLYSVANAFTDPVDHIDPAAPTFYGYKIKLIIDRIPAASLVIQIGPTEAVLGENVGAGSVGPGVYKEAIGNLLRFKRLAEGIGIDLTEDAGSNVITIAARQLTQNVDLYVPATYPGITDPTVLFPDIQSAHDYLLQFHIPADKTATIHVYSGHFTQNVPVNFTHPDSTQIQVVGLDLITKTMRPGVNITRTGTLPNLDIVIPVTSTTGIAVNDIVYLNDAPHVQLESAGIVTVVGGTSITVRMLVYNVLPPSSIMPLATTKLIVYPTQFITSVDNDGVFKCLNGIKLFKNFAFRQSGGTMTGTAIGILGPFGGMEHCICYNFRIGFGIGCLVCNIMPILAANACEVGLQVGPSGNVFLQGINPVGGYTRVTLSGNHTYGLWVVGGSWIGGGNDGTITNTCSNLQGIRCDTRGLVGIAAGTYMLAYMCQCNDQGFVAALLGIIMSSIQAEAAVLNNVTWDFRSVQGGQIALVYNFTMSGLYSPALNLLGPSGGYNAIGAINPV